MLIPMVDRSCTSHPSHTRSRLTHLIYLGTHTVTNKSERTALSGAAYNGTVDVVRLLLAAGAVVDAEDTSGNTALGQCCAGHQCGPQQVECAKVLIEAGASPTHSNLCGETCIDRAKMGGARSEDLAAMLQVLGTTEGS